MPYLLAALALTLIACAKPAPCPLCATPPKLAAIGETFTIESTILGQTRVINVYTPPGYAASSDRYPVLYMPDGGMAEDFPHVVGSVDVSIKNAIIRPVIVVGIENIERRHDLVGPSAIPADLEMAPNAGGADEFRAFVRDELMPWIAARYRTTDEAALIGESLAGLFVVETFLIEPALFDHYISVDPSVWWNAKALVRDAATRLAAFPAGARTLYVATANYPDTIDAVAILTAALTAAALADLAWIHEPMPEAEHSTIFPTAALHGIRRAFKAP